MQKLMSYKKIIICICAVAVVIAAAAIILLSNKEESFRSILVYEIEGSAVIERASVGSMNAAENLYLESGDRVIVAKDSSMRMKLDDDKYVMAEADTIFFVEAEGTDENSKTKIRLEQGAVTNEIQNPLSEGSQYETSTPNSVMAVRGTIYRVELYIDDNGEQNTKMSCFQGKVETTPVLPDGTSGEAVLVPAGSELTIHNDGTADSPRDIAYDELPEQALQNLKTLLEDGQTMEGITLEDLDILIDQAADTSEISENNEPEQTILADAGESSGQSDAKNDTDADVEVAENVSAQADRNVKNSETSQTTEQSKQKAQVTDKTADQPEQKPQTQNSAQTKVSETTNSSSDNNAVESSQSENTGSNSTDNDDRNNGQNNSQNNNQNNSQNSGQNNGGSNDNKPDEKPDEKPEEKPDDKPPVSATYTVTFKYGGNVFATQEVKSGEKASTPLLVPAQSGAWDFDFGTAIEADTTVNWK